LAILGCFAGEVEGLVMAVEGLVTAVEGLAALGTADLRTLVGETEALALGAPSLIC